MYVCMYTHTHIHVCHNCMYVHTHIYMFAQQHKHTYVQSKICILMRTYALDQSTFLFQYLSCTLTKVTFIFTSTPLHVHARRHTYVHSKICILMRTYALDSVTFSLSASLMHTNQSYIYFYINAHTYTHTQTCMCF
jgi:hypothetical protein